MRQAEVMIPNQMDYIMTDIGSLGGASIFRNSIMANEHLMGGLG